MKISILKSFVAFIIMLNFVGVAVVAAPAKIVNRTVYSTALNSVAAIVMNWYGSLITVDESTIKNSLFNTKNIGGQWHKYRSQYPKNISQIIITSTELLKLKASGDYQFKVKSKIAYKQQNKILTQSIKETFIFKNTLLSDQNEPVIKAINRDKQEVAESFEIAGYNGAHYKVREFTYAWLAYIDGINTLKTTMNAKAWLDKASYSLAMGNEQSTTNIESALSKKKQLLTYGGHLLHSLEIKDENKETNTFVIDLILEWKGMNKTGKPVIARIHQEIKVQIKTDKTWEVLSIKEKHLLPIIAPWMGLVC